jgi:hypothetical protein
MRKMPTVLAAAALLAAGMPSAQAATAPTVSRAWIAVDAGQVGAMDPGDVLKIRFTKPIVITDITSVGVEVVGANGEHWRLENEGRPDGAYFSARSDVLTMRINLDLEAYGQSNLTYPLELRSGSPWPQVFYNIAGKNGVPVAVGTRDPLID